jgi:hypothetical protein
MGGEADVVLARFFTIDGGHWSQKRVEIELTAAAEHQRLQKLRTAAASAARRGRNDTDVQTVTDTVTDTVTSTSSPSPSPSQVQLPSSSREGSLKGTTALVPSAPSSTSEDSCQERSKQGNGGEPKTKAKTTKLRKPLNGEWIIEDGDARDLYAKKVGMTEHDIDVECDKFENFHRAKGTLFADAEAGWRTWCRNWQTYRERRI